MSTAVRAVRKYERRINGAIEPRRHTQFVIMTILPDWTGLDMKTTVPQQI